MKLFLLLSSCLLLANAFTWKDCSPEIPRGKIVVRDGRKYIIKCVADGDHGLSVTSHAAETPNGTADSSSTACDNGKKLGEDWVRGKTVHQDNKPDVTDIIPIVAVKSCVVDGVAIPVGETRNVPSGTCACKRNDGENDSAVKSASYRCTGTSAASQETTTIPATTKSAESKKTTKAASQTPKPLNCALAENLGKEWVDGNFVKACKEIKAENAQNETEVIAIVVRCILSKGEEIAVGGRKEYPYGSCWCKRVYNLPERSDLRQVPVTRAVAICKGIDCSKPESLVSCVNRSRTILKKKIYHVDYVAIRCLVQDHDQLRVGENKTTANGVFSCQQRADLAVLIYEEHIKSSTTTTVATPKTRPFPKCSGGHSADEEWVDGEIVKTCKLRTSKILSQNVTIANDVSIRCITPEGHKIPVGEKKNTRLGIYICMQWAISSARLKFVNHSDSPKSSTTSAPLPRCSNGAILGSTWLFFGTVLSCKLKNRKDSTGQHNISSMKLVANRCITPEWHNIPVGQNRTTDIGVYRCVPPGSDYVAALKHVEPNGSTEPTTPPATCENGVRVGQVKLDGRVSRYCHRDLRMVATHCYIAHKSLRNNGWGTHFRCEKRGEFDAELVSKAMSKMCEDRDITVDTWIESRVVRDCIRGAEKPAVHARLCILDDERIIEIGKNITEEFVTYKCERVGERLAVLREDTKRIHLDFWRTSNTCMNGRKVGEDWTEKGVRRFCSPRKGEKPEIFEFGCELPNGRVISVGTKAKWDKEWDESTKNTPDEDFHRTLYCEKGASGFGAVANLVDFQTAPELRYCENGKHERQEWPHKNVLRTCKEIDDKMTIVALHCVIGNETMAISELKRHNSKLSSECARVGQHDADLYLHFEEERNEPILRNKIPTIVAFGCILNDGRILGIGENDDKTEEMPGYEHIYSKRCMVDEKDGARLYIASASTVTRHDEKNPCGKNKYGDVSERFIKKFKVIEGNILSGVAIGCITFKNTHMLEGEVVEEDHYNIKCHRNEDGKLHLHYAFTFTEQ